MILRAMPHRPQVGVAVAIRRGWNVLLHKRRGSIQAGTYGFPGGHLEFGEQFAECAMREIREECGAQLKISTPKFWTVVNCPTPDEHFITILLVADYRFGEPKNTEPNKSDGWAWHDWNDLPKPLMLGIQQVVDAKDSPFRV